MDTCQDCGRKYIYDRKKGHKKTTCNSCTVTRARRRIKQKAIELKGGKCIVCGYDRHHGSLSFHHLDPTKKDFGLSVRGIFRSWERVKKELEKCVLVCHNCHGEIHAGITTI